jgi:hypothetical protein
MKKVDILEMPTRSEMRNPEALKNRMRRHFARSRSTMCR